MPRKSVGRPTTGTPKTEPASAPSGSLPKRNHKRHLSAGGNVASATGDATDHPTSVTPGTRASKRLKDSATSTPVTGKKSKYFDGPGSEDEDEDLVEASSASPSGDDSASGYGDDSGSASEENESGQESEDDYDSEEDTKRRSKGSKSRAGTGKAFFGKQNSQMWREGVKTGLGPGKQVFIEKPKPRGDGGIKYVADRIHPNTMLFLEDLKANNDREWLKMHDPDFRQSWKDWESLVDVLSEKISEIDETVPELPPKDLVFRIYRDVRFSKDPTPYKPHFSAAWSRTGRKGPYACYYVQISPHGKSFVGAGLWMPEAAPLALLRRDIVRKPEKLRKVLTDPAMRKHILGGIANDPKKAVKAFANQNQDNALKTAPKGYSVEDASIELLRLRNYTAGHRLPEQTVLSPSLVKEIAVLIGSLYPLVTYLNSVVMPEDDASSSDASDPSEDEM
ncbi:uncharacterized protein AB675_9758 [Cyphellophora attinorum]|uniref:TIGR02453 family protein n=1 Tax=Cyphellophora attinorum TaxID=1664694 RepID=A0A0N1H7K8_9EURO|nr:uncharacterized protein AB675_9758 [Phialophora attinorum]KPI42535.1 hypothetical protein AB675_9758 [Phialophora attinorum]